MGYTRDEASVRVDFFRADEHGRPYKWYATEAVVMSPYEGSGNGGALLHDAFLQSVERHLEGRYRGMVAFCADPYHEYGHPIVVRVP